MHALPGHEHCVSEREYLEATIRHDAEMVALEFKLRDAAEKLRASETERRLELLNGEREDNRKNWGESVRRGTFDDFKETIMKQVEELKQGVAARAGGTRSLVVAFGILLSILTIIIPVAMRFIAPPTQPAPIVVTVPTAGAPGPATVVK
jgi:hypothetical protein